MVDSLPVSVFVVAVVVTAAVFGFGVFAFVRNRRRQQLQSHHDYRMLALADMEQRRINNRISTPQGNNYVESASSQVITKNIEAIRREKVEQKSTSEEGDAAQQISQRLSPATPNPPTSSSEIRLPKPPPPVQPQFSTERIERRPSPVFAPSPGSDASPIQHPSAVKEEALCAAKSEPPRIPVKMEKASNPPTDQAPSVVQELKMAATPVSQQANPAKQIHEIPPNSAYIQPRPATDNIVDVTGQSSPIPPMSERTDGLVKYAAGVPYWRHQYVFSADEVNYATPEQRAFYSQFRTAFLNGTCYDVEGNSNYYFILFFDLIENYEHIQQLPVVERQLERLGDSYPKTKLYVRRSLHRRMQEIGDAVGAARYKPVETSSPYAYSYDPDSWKFGNRLKSRFKLTADEIKLLNRLPGQANNFLDIEYCLEETVRFFLRVVRRLEAELESQGGFDRTIEEVYDVVARKQHRYRKGSTNYNSYLAMAREDLYDTVFRYCENAYREFVGHKRKLAIDGYYTGEAKAALEERLISGLRPIVSEEVNNVRRPDHAFELELNRQNTTRWKAQFDELKNKAETLSADQFLDAVMTLASLNERNPSRENIYFEASKTLARRDRQRSLEMYIHYVHADLRSEKFDNKALTKTIQKCLFQNTEQLQSFEKIIADLIHSKDLTKALAAIPEIYAEKRKRIRLNRKAITEVREKHHGTVELLNEYLQDDFEDEHTTIHMRSATDDELSIEISAKNAVEETSRASGVGFNSQQIALIELFERGGYSMDNSDVEQFAREHGLFKGQLIESINDACFEILDDVLIIEESDELVVDPDYLRKIFVDGR